MCSMIKAKCARYSPTPSSACPFDHRYTVRILIFSLTLDSNERITSFSSANQFLLIRAIWLLHRDVMRRVACACVPGRAAATSFFCIAGGDRSRSRDNIRQLDPGDPAGSCLLQPPLAPSCFHAATSIIQRAATHCQHRCASVAHVVSQTKSLLISAGDLENHGHRN
jgi:hypothetical protein